MSSAKHSSLTSNYTLRVMPLPLYDIGKATVREPQVEAEVQKMQVYIYIECIENSTLGLLMNYS